MAFLKDGKYRLKFLNEINDSPKIPSELAFKFNITRVTASRVLRDLTNKGLIERTNNETRTVLYSITPKGEDVLKEAQLGKQS